MKFECKDVFFIKNRGWCMTGNLEGELNPGDYICCEGVTTKVLGIERFCVPKDHPGYNKGVGLLVDVDYTAISIGQIWQ